MSYELELEPCPYCDKITKLSITWGKGINDTGKPYYWRLALCKTCKDNLENRRATND